MTVSCNCPLSLKRVSLCVPHPLCLILMIFLIVVSGFVFMVDLLCVDLLLFPCISDILPRYSLPFGYLAGSLSVNDLVSSILISLPSFFFFGMFITSFSLSSYTKFFLSAISLLFSRSLFKQVLSFTHSSFFFLQFFLLSPLFCPSLIYLSSFSFRPGFFYTSFSRVPFSFLIFFPCYTNIFVVALSYACLLVMGFFSAFEFRRIALCSSPVLLSPKCSCPRFVVIPAPACFRLLFSSPPFF